ncbi:MAG: response regulator [Woeseia sp.]
MSLTKKIALYFALLGTCLALGSYAAISHTVFPAFEEFEADATLDAIERVNRVMDSERLIFETMLVEYAHWNDTYNFVLDRNENYVRDNLDPAYWRTIGVHVVLILNNEGELIWSTNTEIPGGAPVNAAELFLVPLSPSHPLFQFRPDQESMSGMLQSRDGPMMIAAAPVLTTYAEGPAVGTFIIGRHVRDDFISDLAKRASADALFVPINEHPVLGHSVEELRHMTLAGELRHVHRVDNMVVGHDILLDLTGRPIAVSEVSLPPFITAIGSNAISAAMLLICVVTIIFLIVGLVAMRYLIVRPVNVLSESMAQIRKTGDLNVEVERDRSDEIGALAREFDEMTTNLHLAQCELEATRDVAVEASRAKSDFLARMSHEIRTPMNGVLGMTELLRNTTLDFEQRRFADTIYTSAEGLLAIINDILDFSKIEAGKMELEERDINVGSLIEETVDTLASQAHKKGLELINDVAPELHTSLRGDPVRIRQVLTNLIANAIKFTNRGEVVVRAAAVHSDEDGVDVQFEVIDTGVGIKRDSQRLIFESFAQEDGSTTRMYGGTGLGLAICRQLVNLMGGAVNLESKPGFGSRFYFTVRMPHGESSGLRGDRHLKSVAGKRILVVDDNSTNREILEQQLGGWRAHCESACDADDALKRLDISLIDKQPYDLVILDMHMPRVDGLQLARQIREYKQYTEVPLVILSSVATPASEDVMNELRISGQLTKPIRQGQLYDALSVVLGGYDLTQSIVQPGVTTLRALSGSVLLAEDNPVNQAVALGMLDSLSVRVVVVADGEAAAEAANRQRFDVILMDCQMPVLDGLAATRRIRSLEKNAGKPAVPIVALTANAMTGDREQCLAAGMNDYLAKPFTMEQLHAVLSVYLRANDGTTAPHAEDSGSDTADEFSGDPLDRTALDVLMSLQQPGAPNLVEKVISIYLDSSGANKERLANAISSKSPEGIREAAHALKSSSINVGATRFADICKTLEAKARAQDLSGIADYRERLEHEYERVVEALRTEIQALAK